MGHENDGFGALLYSVFDGGQGSYNALVVRNLVSIERNVEIDLYSLY